ncbi:MAG: DNA-directed RNA polymerase subunit alpha C-terminal domain-containing protein [Planctomycetaceae bacterium]
MSTLHAPPDPVRVLEGAAADHAEAAALRRKVMDDTELRRGLRRFVEEDGRRPEECDSRDAGLRATALHILGRDDEVGPFAERCDAPRVRFLWGLSEIYRNRVVTAADVLLEALRREPRDERIRLEAAALVALLGRTTEARELLQPLASRDDRADVLFAKGAIAEAEGDPATAQAHYEAALALDPSHVNALFRLAFQHDLGGDDDAAIALYERARHARPTRVNVLLNLGLLYEDTDQFDKAAACYREILSRYPEHARARPFFRDAESSKSMVFDEDQERKDDRRNQILTTPISDFELSVRSRNCLAKMSILSLGDLIQRTEPELLAYKNFGETSLQEIKELLTSKGLRLGMRKEEVMLPAEFGEEQAFLDEEDDDDADETLPDVPLPVGVDAEALQLPLADLELSVRSMRCVAQLNLQTIGELTQKSESELLQNRNFGETSLEEIKSKLAQLGLSLRPE